MMMRDGRLERFLLLPFSIRCDSKSSVALATTTLPAKRLKSKQKGGEEQLSKLKMKKNQCISKVSFSQRVNRLIRHFKGFPHFFVYKQGIEEIEIGFPTDVKHVTHIGLDGSTTFNPVPNWENLEATQLLSYPSISLQQFDLAMAAQSHGTLGIN
ncbi:hypothetical protein CDL12_23488 [Handroanthus impetiginosus]|uniref:CRIB domain-containing protein n=1 Tax=Handroanthus impetiginosus TaxID=429701 RepID=A0A2G9GFJ0_9LAMI|nr:hypothetical protein CDL12_23488 [Handroanthus impetiginosus]